MSKSRAKKSRASRNTKAKKAARKKPTPAKKPAATVATAAAAAVEKSWTEELAPTSPAGIVRQTFADLLKLLTDRAIEVDGVDEGELRHFLTKAVQRIVKDPNLDGLCHTDVRQGLAAAEHFLLVASTWHEPDRCRTAQRSLAMAMILCRAKPM